MTAAKKILIVFPHNFLEKDSGVNKRYFELVSYLKQSGYTIDLLGLRNFKSNWKKFAGQNSAGLINRLFLYNFRTGYARQRLLSLISKLNFTPSVKNRNPGNLLPDYAFPGMISVFGSIMKNNRYDIVIVGYVYWARLLRVGLSPGTMKVLTVEDFISLKLSENSAGDVDLDESIKEEVARVNLFDKVICLSYEELKFFSSEALHPEYFFVPVFMTQPGLVKNTKAYDLLFIGSDNADNIEGLDWFFKKVFPFLLPDLKIVVIGKIARYAPDLSSVTKMDYIPDPGEIYSKSKISINPLQKGTGMKVKVIESLAYGMPMVNTSKGLCGIPPAILDKFIVADDPRNFAGAINRLLTDSAWYEDHCREAKQTFGNYFSPDVVKKELDRLFLPG